MCIFQIIELIGFKYRNKRHFYYIPLSHFSRLKALYQLNYQTGLATFNFQALYFVICLVF